MRQNAKDAFVLAASDAFSAQSVFYATAGETLIGEELFAIPAYLQAGQYPPGQPARAGYLALDCYYRFDPWSTDHIHSKPMRSPVATALAIAFGLIVLLGYFVPANQPAFSSLITLRSIIVGGAVTLAGFASLVAIWGLVGAHWHKLRARRNPDRYSFFMLLGFLYHLRIWPVCLPSRSASDCPVSQQVVNAFQVPD